MTVPIKPITLAGFLSLLLVTACTPAGPEAVEVFDHAGSSLGQVAIEVTCTSEANDHVRRGLALLHNMTYTEAEAEFAAASEADPNCAMAKWGEATSLFHPLWPDVPTAETVQRGKTLLEEATDRTPSALEEAYIAAASAYYAGDQSRSETDRLQAYADGWDNVVSEFPNDIEAKLFQALSRIGISETASDMVAVRSSAGEIAEAVLAKIPNHPGALHYTIHAYDLPELADRAQEEAQIYGKVAPENSHALHMTSHIFTRVGSWDESISYNSRAGVAALKHPVMGGVSMHYLHAADYLVYAYLQQGNDAAAAKVWQEITSLDGPVQNHAGSAYAYAAVPTRMALERHDWQKASAIKLYAPSSITWNSYPHLEAIVVFTRGMGAARSGKPAMASKSVQRLQELENAAAALPGAYDWAAQVRIQRKTVQAWILLARRDTKGALAEMRAAAELEATTTKNPVTPGEVLPATELYGDMLLELNQPAEALKAYGQSLARNRNRLNSLYGAAVASEKLGDTEAAKEYYRQIVSIADDNSDLDLIVRARAASGA